MKALIHLKLRQTFDVSFQKTETTNFYEHVPKKLRDSLKHGEAVGLMALSQDQIIFVYRPLLDEETGRTGVTSVRVRWDGKLRPEMLQKSLPRAGCPFDRLSGIRAVVPEKVRRAVVRPPRRHEKGRQMTSRDFCFWLQGYFEVATPSAIPADQTELIKKHLNLVFLHEIDPSHGDKAAQEKLNQEHSKPPAWGGSPPKVRC